ncbi:MAG: hypothetical protein ACI9FG_001717, partial [Crocinitomicaceae bacterium]
SLRVLDSGSSDPTVNRIQSSSSSQPVKKGSAEYGKAI